MVSSFFDIEVCEATLGIGLRYPQQYVALLGKTALINFRCKATKEGCFMKNNIGEKICQYRQMQKMTQEEFASRLGVTPQAVGK